MRSRCFLSSLLACLLAAAPAGAGTLTSATWTQVVAPHPAALGVSATIIRTAAALGATGNSTATSIAVALSFPAFMTSFFGPPFTPSSGFYPHVRISQGGPQAITATAGAGAGAPGIPGTVVVMTAVHPDMGVKQSVFMVGFNTLVALPLSNGKAGQFTSTFVVLGHLLTVTVDFYIPTAATAPAASSSKLPGSGTHVGGRDCERFQRGAAPASNVGPAGCSPCGTASAVTKVREIGESSRGSRV
jgi:hypothetical protein